MQNSDFFVEVIRNLMTLVRELKPTLCGGNYTLTKSLSSCTTLKTNWKMQTRHILYELTKGE
jgi:hypothetical protein